MLRRMAARAVCFISWSACVAACSGDTEESESSGGSANTADSTGGTANASDSAGGTAGSAGAAMDELQGEPFPPDDRTPRPSSACASGEPRPPVGGQRLLTGGVEGNYLITRPPGYDGSTPFPLAFVFHGANNTEITCRSGGNCLGVAAALEGEAVVIYMRSFGTSWTGSELDQNVTYFDDLLAHAKATYCVDERKVFALGTSSGAHFANILACRRGPDLLAVIPGSGERFENEGCSGRVAALVLHGIDDTSVPLDRGEAARDAYAAQNGCSSETVPPIAEMHAEVREARDSGVSTYGCVDFQGCTEGLPVRWCEHSEPGYDQSTHGWPVVGGELAWEFVRDL